MESREEMLRRIVREEIEASQPHECWLCESMQLRTEVPHMRTCHNPAKMELDEHGFCKLWILAKDWRTRKKHCYI